MLRTLGSACEPGNHCPVTRAVQALGGKWKLHIIFQLMQGTKRFGELQRAIPGVTQQMLTSQLRELENDGIITRKIYAQVPPKVEYSLTPLGNKLRSVTDALTVWGHELPAEAEIAAAI
ncbi:MAG TPA: helix-turn-helix domain-containing protein [Ensifer sp.]|nr:helix-turn-helix domain-containing protein [Ensifer sp.]